MGGGAHKNDSNVPLHHIPRTDIVLSDLSLLRTTFLITYVISTERQRAEKSIGNIRSTICPYRLFVIINFTDRFLHAFACAHLVEMTVGTMFGMVEITGVVEMTNMIAFCAEGALILTSTRSGAAHFTPPCNKAFLWYWVGAVFHMPKAYFTRAAYFTLLTDFSMRPTSSGLVEMTGGGWEAAKARQRYGKGRRGRAFYFFVARAKKG